MSNISDNSDNSMEYVAPSDSEESEPEEYRQPAPAANNLRTAAENVDASESESNDNDHDNVSDLQADSDSDNPSDADDIGSSSESDAGNDHERHPTRPMINFDRDNDVYTQPDETFGWERLDIDSGASYQPFSAFAGLIAPLRDPDDPMEFFRMLFEEEMFERLAQETNNYANAKQTSK